MKRALLITSIITAVTAIVAAAAAPAATTSAPPCTPKIITIQGHRAGVNCGPATATLHVNGKTYTFRNGYCEQSKAAGTQVELNLGTAVLGAKNNLGRSGWSIVIAKSKAAAVFSAYYGGKKVLAGENLINVKGTVAKGTFTPQLPAGPKFSGSWDCHGVIWKGP